MAVPYSASAFDCLTDIPNYAVEPRFSPVKIGGDGRDTGTLNSTIQCSQLWMMSETSLASSRLLQNIKLDEHGNQPSTDIGPLGSGVFPRVHLRGKNESFRVREQIDSSHIDFPTVFTAEQPQEVANSYNSAQNCRCFGIFSPYYPDCGEPPEEGYAGELQASCKPWKNDFAPAWPYPLGPWVKHHLGEQAHASFCKARVCAGGGFMTTRQNIHARPQATYKGIYKELGLRGGSYLYTEAGKGGGPEVGYYMEKVLQLAYGWNSIDHTVGRPSAPSPLRC
eukprot:3044162-Prymnesium_polylepis.1